MDSILEKRKENHGAEFFIEKSKKIYIADNLTYLGINFSLADADQTHSQKALHAYYNLCYCFDKLPCNIKLKIYLFDKMIGPILVYGSVVWKKHGYKEIDKLHLKICRYILGVKQQTPNFSVNGSFG